MTRARTVVAGVAVWGIWILTTPGPFAAQDAPPTFHASAHSVSVDVAVRQRGRPVTGLTASDFALLDNDVPQAIALDRTGNVYVAEYGGEKITLLRPDESQLNNSPTVAVNPKVMKFDAVRGQTSPSQVLIIKNTGVASLTVNQVLFTGAEPGDYTCMRKPPPIHPRNPKRLDRRNPRPAPAVHNPQTAKRPL